MTTSPITTITDELLAELEAAAKAATPGPWSWDDREVDENGYVYIPECSYLVGLIALAGHYEDYELDCDFMALANPATILALLAERAELKRDAERYQFIANTCEVILHGKEIEDGAELDAAMQEAKP